MPVSGAAEIAPFNGVGGKRIYLAVDGVVFDMSSHETGPSFYGPGGAYGVFAGRDASIGLASMQTDPAQWKRTSVTELSASERDIVYDWLIRFRNKYTIVGSCIEGSNPTTLQQLKDRNLLL